MLNFKNVGRFYRVSTGNQTHAAVVELWGPIVYLKGKRYKHFTVELCRGPMAEVDLFMKAVQQLYHQQEEIVTMADIVDFIRQNREELKALLAAEVIPLDTSLNFPNQKVVG